MQGNLVLGGAVIGAITCIVGYNLHPDTKVIHDTTHEVRTVKVPHYIIEPPKTKTVYKDTEWPESCETTMDYMKLSVSQSNKFNTKASNTAQYLNDLDMRELNDTNAAHDTEIRLAKLARSLDDTNYIGMEVQYKAKTFLSVCESDLAKAQHGDHVTASDGRHVTSP